MTPISDKWHGLPLYDRPLGCQIQGLDDGRPVVWLTDFSACEPGDRIGTDGLGGAWQLIDYATDRFAGRMLHAPRQGPAGEVTLPLEVSGWYAVYLWMMGGDVDLEPGYPADFDSVFSQSPGPELKLTADRRFSGLFRTLTHDRMMWLGLEACFWRYVDLTDQSLVIRHQGGAVYLGAVQLVPLSPAEVQAVERGRADRATKRLIVKGDMYAPRELERMAEHLRHTDVGGWIIGCEDHADLMAPQGSVRLKAMRDTARDLGVEWYVCDRPSLWSAHFHWPDERARWFARHPEVHCLDRDGTDTHQASYAVKEVQDFMLARARAAAKLGPDGFGYFFNRDPGLVLFEPAAMAGFQDKHGVDPRTLDDRDERLLDWRADILTGFMRRVRQTLDEVAAEEGHSRIKIVAVVLGDEAANRFFSFDVPRWVREGLVDILMPYPWRDYPDRWLAQGFADMDLTYFADLTRGTDCQLVPMWLSGEWRQHWTAEHVRPDEYFIKAMRDYAAGADGLSAWDNLGLDRPFTAARWLRLGHKDDLAMWAAHDFPLPPKLRFTKLAGCTPDRYPAGTGG